MVSHNTALVSSLELRIGLACEAGLSAGMWRECVPPQRVDSVWQPVHCVSKKRDYIFDDKLN